MAIVACRELAGLEAGRAEAVLVIDEGWMEEARYRGT